MSANDLKEFEKLTIGDLIEFAKILKLSTKDAFPKMNAYKEKYKLSDVQTQKIYKIVRLLELYK